MYDKLDWELMPIEMDKEWIAVKGDMIMSKGNTKQQAKRAAEHLGMDYDEVVAIPKGGSYV